MRAEPPPPPRRRDRAPDSAPQAAPNGWRGPRQRCPYLEQILKERAGPFGMLVRYKADCHVDRRMHRFTGRHPHPPCITDPTTCNLWRQAHGDEDQVISRYTD
ncbi:MAG: hypothetical protein NVS3B18_12150 [Candidatus Dormibacteria bacterium]